jgi:MFS family permease
METASSRPVTSKAHPAVFFLLHMPMGIVGGFTTVLFPFLATKAGLPVSATASIVAVGMLAQSIRILWAPFADVVLTLKTWCVLGSVGIVALLTLLALVPLNPGHEAMYAAALFVLNATACIENTPVPGLLAHNIAEERKGTASGLYMAGYMVGSAASGSAGIWIAAHTGSAVLACAALSVGCLASLVGLMWVEEPPRHLSALPVLTRFKSLALDLWGIVKTPAGAYVGILVMMPVGLGATDADLMAGIAGLGTTVATLLGCIVGGWISDQADSIRVFLGSAGLLCLIGFGLAIGPRVPMAFATLSLAYMLATGLCNASYGTMLYRIVGRENAAFKYTAINSFGNIPGSYMTAFNGYVHDRVGSAGMLNTEAGICAVLIAVFLGARRVLRF